MWPAIARPAVPGELVVPPYRCTQWSERGIFLNGLDATKKARLLYGRKSYKPLVEEGVRLRQMWRLSERMGL